MNSSTEPFTISGSERLPNTRSHALGGDTDRVGGTAFRRQQLHRTQLLVGFRQTDVCHLELRLCSLELVLQIGHLARSLLLLDLGFVQAVCRR